jgi:hypothetical protein
MDSRLKNRHDASRMAWRGLPFQPCLGEIDGTPFARNNKVSNSTRLTREAN